MVIPKNIMLHIISEASLYSSLKIKYTVFQPAISMPRLFKYILCVTINLSIIQAEELDPEQPAVLCQGTKCYPYDPNKVKNPKLTLEAKPGKFIFNILF